MKLNFKIREPATFFHFLDSLSSWSIHTGKSAQRYYKELFGISKKDMLLLEAYVSIREKYQWKELDSDFYLARNFEEVYFNIQKRVTSQEFSILLGVVEHFRPNIRKIFLDWKPYLLLRRKSLLKESKKHKLERLFSEVGFFYESKNYLSSVTVHLVVNVSTYSSGGGANIMPREHVTLRPEHLKSKHSLHVLNGILVMIHEILHIIEHKINEGKWGKFKRLTEKSGLDFEILTEAIADTLVPDGYLALKYGIIENVGILSFNRLKTISKYRTVNKGRYYRKSRQKLSAILYPLTKKQFESKRTIFEGDYIKGCIEKYLKMKRET